MRISASSEALQIRRAFYGDRLEVALLRDLAGPQKSETGKRPVLGEFTLERRYSVYQSQAMRDGEGKGLSLPQAGKVNN